MNSSIFSHPKPNLIRTRFARIVAPQPPQRIRKNRAAVQVVVEAGSPGVPVVVAGILQGSCEGLVRKPPAPRGQVEIVGSILKEHANWFFRKATDTGFVVVSATPLIATRGDVRKAAGPRDHLAEL